MNRKLLTSANGNVLQITLSPFEAFVLQRAVSQANIPSIRHNINVIKDDPFYTDVQVVGTIIRNFYNLLEK